MPASLPSSRREFLRETFAFSALAFLGSRTVGRTAPPAPLDSSGHHLLALGDWGYDSSHALQSEIARAMQTFVQTNPLKTGALLMLGDNFYGPLTGLENSPRWQTQFEDMYPRASFDCPCYAILGNHDYNLEPRGKTEAQLAYAKKPGTRWTMPAKWYRFEFPAENPLITFLALDSNYQQPTEFKNALSLEERVAQQAWLEAELAKPRTTPYLIALGHHPLYSNGLHGDTKALAPWDALFRKHRVHAYLCGHDHDMQHLEFQDHPTSFVVSGGGGAELTFVLPSWRGPYASFTSGFTHLQVTPEKLVIRHVDRDGATLHAFSKTPAGKMELLT